MRKKPITEVTDEELLKLLEGNSETSELNIEEYPNDVLEFMSVFNLQNGPYPVKTAVLGRFYSQWSQNPLKPNQFTKELHKFLNIDGNNFMLNITNNEILKKTLKHLEKRDNTKLKISKLHFDNFIKKYNIQKGDFWMKDIVFYDLYDKWSYEINKKRPFSFYSFKKFCNLYFMKKSIHSNDWYAVNKSIIKHLTEEMRNVLTNKKVTNVKKKDKKRYFKVSGS